MLRTNVDGQARVVGSDPANNPLLRRSPLLEGRPVSSCQSKTYVVYRSLQGSWFVSSQCKLTLIVAMLLRGSFGTVGS